MATFHGGLLIPFRGGLARPGPKHQKTRPALTRPEMRTNVFQTVPPYQWFRKGETTASHLSTPLAPARCFTPLSMPAIYSPLTPELGVCVDAPPSETQAATLVRARDQHHGAAALVLRERPMLRLHPADSAAGHAVFARRTVLEQILPQS